MNNTATIETERKLLKIPTPLPFQTPGEEIANSILHGIGILLATAGLILLVLRNSGYLGGTVKSSGAIALYVIFTASMILMFTASTLYHAVQHEKAKRVLRVLDHCSVYLLIAGTYTPMSILGLGGAWGWAYFGVIWGLAICGITLYSLGWKPLKKVEVFIYIIMGWLILFGFFHFVNAIPRISLILLLGGGVIYTMGTFWYRKKHRRGSHIVWHCFVIGGAFSHWLSLWFLS